MSLNKDALIMAAFAAALVAAPLSARAASPTAVYDAEGPGHTPYRTSTTVNPPCSAQSSCTLTFAAVPAGKRLVVTHLSCSVRLAYPAFLTEAKFYSSKVANVIDYLPMTQLYATNTIGQTTDFVVNLPETMIFNAGESPVFFFTESGGVLPYQGGSCTLTGYYAKA